MTKIVLMTAVLLGAVQGAFAAPAEPDAATRYFTALRGFEEALSAGRTQELAALGKPLREAARGLREENRSAPSCLRSLESGAWSVADLASAGKSPDRIKTEVQRLWVVTQDCGLAGRARLSSLSEARWAVATAGSMIAGAEHALSQGARCGDKKVSVDGIVADISDGKFSVGELEAIQPGIGSSVMHYYQHAVFAGGDPKACDRLKGVDTLFLDDSQVVAKLGGWGCREWYNEKAFTQALVSKSKDFGKVCRTYIAQGYPEMSAEDNEAICAAFSPDMSDSPRICKRLIPRYLSENKLEACVSEFDRYKVYTDETACKSLESWPGPWLQRCHDYAAYSKAYKAKDPELCKDSELCRLYMGDWSRMFAARYEDLIGKSFCTAIGRSAELDRSAALSWLDRGAEYAAQARGDEAAIKSLKSEIEALRERGSKLPARHAALTSGQGLSDRN